MTHDEMKKLTVKLLDDANSTALYNASEVLAKTILESDFAPEVPWEYHFEEVDEEFELAKDNEMSQGWEDALVQAFRLLKWGRGYNGYRKGDIWVLIDLFYNQSHYLYVYNDYGVCIGTCLVTRDASGKQTFDWDRPWFPRQEFSPHYGSARWD